jgi:hypothetical protein
LPGDEVLVLVAELGKAFVTVTEDVKVGEVIADD